MDVGRYVPQIAFECDSSLTPALQVLLRKVLPEGVFIQKEADTDFREDQKLHFQSLLPLVRHSFSEGIPGTLSLYLLYLHRTNAFKFFFEMLSRWLLPAKKLTISMVVAADFTFPELGDDLYTLCEIKVRVQSKEELEQIKKILPMLETEAKLGVESNYYARRILEVYGLSADEKLALVQDQIGCVVRRHTPYFGSDLLSEMQHVLVLCREDFIQERSSRHLSRIIAIHSHFKRQMREGRRRLFLKIFRFSPPDLGERKNLLGFIVAVNFLKENESFEKNHLLKSIQNYIPSAREIENSFIKLRRGSENHCTLYLEIQKADESEFTFQEVTTLRRLLPLDLKDRIEFAVHPVFMPRNEEEIFRNVLILGNEIKYLRDIPQVIIIFDEQTHRGLYFTVILVRVAKPGALSIEELFKQSKSGYSYIQDRIKTVGMLRKKYIKEATIFRLKLPKEPFLRRDNSIDLYKARAAVFDELCQIVGEVRDFNGGMISKQNEVLTNLRKLVGAQAGRYELILENFFHSLTPVAVRTLMEPEVLKKLFLMLLEAIESGIQGDEGYVIKMCHDPEFVYMMIKARDRHVREEITRIFSMLQISSPDLVRSYVKIYDIPYIGYIYRCDNSEVQRQFIKTIHNILHAWEYQKKNPSGKELKEVLLPDL